jgi:repressor LexA
MAEKLSDKQKRILDFINEYIQREGRPPTNREIGSAMKITSTGHVDYHLSRLEEKGYIHREKAKSRAIRLARRGLPIYGSIAAGQPLYNRLQNPDMLDLSDTLSIKGSYALEVRGDSMIEEHIFDGDFVIIESEPDIHNGDIVVATRKDTDSEGAATLKRFHREGQRIRLQPANPDVSPIYVDAHEWETEWEVQGKVKAVIRRL